MPFPVAAAITAGATLAGAGANVYASGKMNKKTREWNDKQYERTRRDALADFATQNEYNSPLAQMQRFRDAGLNPNLIYGQSTEAAPIRSSETPAWTPRAPQIDLDAGPTVSAYFDTRLKEAQTDNLRAAITVQDQDALLKAAQTAATIQGTAKTAQDVEQAGRLNPFILEAAQENIRKIQADTQQTMDNNERQKALTASSLTEAAERISTMRIGNAKTQAEKDNIIQGLKNLKLDETLKRLEVDLRKKGINPQDPAWMRILGRYLDEYLPDPKDSSGSGVNDFIKPQVTDWIRRKDSAMKAKFRSKGD